jgi:hypothetical protein
MRRRRRRGRRTGGGGSGRDFFEKCVGEEDLVVRLRARDAGIG